ncbi:hypothetical protein T492DRAFT_49411 [Pavlovales sp. CCMP2436]|nr:hypothetical protein T492DRAFT_49411 [Pavlovales sp. CCMP2436]
MVDVAPRMAHYTPLPAAHYSTPPQRARPPTEELEGFDATVSRRALSAWRGARFDAMELEQTAYDAYDALLAGVLRSYLHHLRAAAVARGDERARVRRLSLAARETARRWALAAWAEGAADRAALGVAMPRSVMLREPLRRPRAGTGALAVR